MKLNNQDKSICINTFDLGTKYPFLGGGVEGKVYKYSETEVIKIFNEDEELDLESIIPRIKYFSSINIDNFTFPKSFVVNDENDILGYSMPLINSNKYGSFFNLFECTDNDEFMDYFIKANENIKDIHKKNIYIGDFNPNNIMIDENDNPVFIDSINYATLDFDFLILPYNSMMYEKIFNKKCSLLDNDKFMFALLFLSYFISLDELDEAVRLKDFSKIINNFNISDKAKSILANTLSDKDNKDYLDDVLVEFKIHEHKKYDNKFFMIVKTINKIED